MSQQAGWYDDPQNAENLRYWDGVQWTDHTSPKQKPDLDRAGQAGQAGAGAWGPAPGQLGTGQGQQQGDVGQAGGYGQPGGPFAGQGYGQAYGQAGQQPQEYGQNPWAGQTGQQPYQPMPGGYGSQDDPRSRTPDGQPLAGWWHRVGARLIDGVIILGVALALLPVVAPGFMSDLMAWTLEQDDPFAPLPADIMDRQLRWVLSIGVFALVYEIVMVQMFGGTVGKLATGLRVRLRDQSGTVGWGPSAIRALIYQGPGLIGNLSPVLSFLGLFNIINVLWPLWDSKRQALHDKVARTNVVRKG
ncbi:RDD family protein [Ornithinimicrobium cerasi]|uniref:RDD family protein n=1 Tax=Ornithinimicrobium cerasi TaxID=2248773 RepID=UPI000EFED530|nr:RDD family protein [Ornithinimicrobium cerasi]